MELVLVLVDRVQDPGHGDYTGYFPCAAGPRTPPIEFFTSIGDSVYPSEHINAPVTIATRGLELFLTVAIVT